MPEAVTKVDAPEEIVETPEVIFDDTPLFRTLKVIGAVFVVLAPISVLTLAQVGVLHRLWIAFLAANLLVWTGVVLIAGYQAAARGLATARTANRERRDQAVRATLAVE